MSDQNFEWRYLENEKSFFKNLKTDFHHYESCFIWEIIIFYAGIPLNLSLYTQHGRNRNPGCQEIDLDWMWRDFVVDKI